TATCVRVPVYISHSESVNVEIDRELSIEELRSLLDGSPGIKVIDEVKKSVYPTPTYTAGKDECFVGRIRKDDTVKYGYNLWIVSDNLRKGAALNAVQIGEEIIKKKLL
ncbi:MAG: aspartate-semialdehyde dehydrogenase, partial [Actinomycetia bacterium]|nr:aspartate-semialdehyde dehydrogenase [Actinomycetes bacterium]